MEDGQSEVFGAVDSWIEASNRFFDLFNVLLGEGSSDHGGVAADLFELFKLFLDELHVGHLFVCHTAGLF